MSRRRRHHDPETLHVLQYGVHDPSYPRNSRVREHLRGLPGVTVAVQPRARGGRRPVRALRDLAGLLRGARGADVLLLAEFRLTHAPLLRLAALVTRARVVVDAFVGLHETVVGDERRADPRSLRARRLALQDALALRSADLVLVDTAPRALALRRAARGRVPVLPLAVGAPGWARWCPLPAADPDGALRLLYYGGYLPLHGVDLVLDALAELRGRRAYRAVFVGAGDRRAAAEARAGELGLSDVVTFVDPVPEAELAEHIRACDVVLGVFGSSPKARGVVANKVWQGLARGRVVVTQGGPALDGLREVVGEQLVAVEPGSPAALAEALARVDVPAACAGSRGVDDALERLATGSYGALTGWIETARSER